MRLTKFCKQEQISMRDLSKIIGVSLLKLHIIDKFPKYNLSIGIADKLYKKAGLELNYYSKLIIN